MTEELVSEGNEGQAGSHPVEAQVPRRAYLLPALALAGLAALAIAISFLGYRFRGNLSFGPPRPTRIAFMSDRDGNWEIYLMERDGSNPVNISNSPDNDWIPLHSPGQEQVLFASDRDGAGLDLFLVDLEGGDTTNITQTPETNEIPIAWSPTGSNLVFVSDQGGAEEIFLRETTNSEEQLNLSERDQAQSFEDWSNNSDRFLLAKATEQGMSLFIADVDGNTYQPVTDGSFPVGGGRWSPDGEKVAYMALSPGASSIDIYVADAAGGEARNLTQSASNDGFPRWSPDGSKIAFLSDRDGNFEIYAMDPDGSNQLNLTNTPANESQGGDFSWSPDSSQILFNSDRDANLEVYVMDADGENQVNLSNSPGTDLNAVWIEQ
jgi:Tol biopolymer transport system component